MISVPAQSAIFGGFTGALYKSTRGPRAMMLGSVLGAGVGSVYAYVWSKGYLRFNMWWELTVKIDSDIHNHSELN